MKRAVVLVALLAALPAAAPAQTSQDAPPPATPVFKVEVIGTTPLPGVDLLLEEIPAPVQTAIQRDIDASGALDLSDFLNRRFNAVHVNELQGNPFQTDLSYRGYTASPLLGTPQGISIYMDGVRLNQPFGDVVSWDLIPRLAVATATLMPGSNPLFGLNTLGGAVSLQTKDGRANPGTSVRALFGSHVRRAVEFEHGGARATGLNWYVAGNLFGEDGWREDSPSDVRQLFAKLGWQDAKTDLKLAAAYADNSLNGNGLQEQRLLAQDYASIYTKPDITDNRSTLLNLTGRRAASRTLALSGNVYYRDIRTSTLNGDLNEGSLDQSVYQPGPAEQAALTAAGYAGFPTSGANASNTPFPFWRCIGQALLGDEPGEKCNALLNRGQTAQHNYGASGQLTLVRSSGRARHQFTAGAAYDGSRVAFQQTTQLGFLNPDRSVTAIDAFADGVTGGSVDGVPFDTRVDLDGRLHTESLFATDTIGLGDAWHVTLSGRYNRTSVHNTDGIRPGGGAGSLDGSYVFARLNPAAGVTYTPSRTLNVYAGYSEGSRSPTSIELGCADPAQPCKLPNAMAGDPPLDQVVTRTWEGGLRGGRGPRLAWNAGVFRAGNRDDILFVASTQTGFGYFKNFGSTRRQGVELGINSRVSRVTAGAGYTYLDATYESPETVSGSANSTNDTAAAGAKGLDGTIQIQPGDRIPLVPHHLTKAFADIQVTPKLALDLDLVAASSSFARGNENNHHQADGLVYLGSGSTAGYVVTNLTAHYQLNTRLQLFAQINNLADRHYDSAAQLGPTGFTSAGTFIARPLPAIGGEFPIQQSTFFAPGSPRTFSAGTRFTF